MFNVDLNKFKISIVDYTYEEFQKNKEVLVNKVAVFYFLYFIVSACFLCTIHGGFLVSFVVSLFIAFFVSAVQLQDEFSALKNKYFDEAKREWGVCSKSEIAPRYKAIVDEKRLDNPTYVDLLDGCRRDVRIKGGRVEYYLILKDGKLTRRTIPVNSVSFDVFSGDVSFYVVERRYFVDSRFNEFFKNRQSDNIENFRVVIQSKYIQW